MIEENHVTPIIFRYEDGTKEVEIPTRVYEGVISYCNKNNTSLDDFVTTAIEAELLRKIQELQLKCNWLHKEYMNNICEWEQLQDALYAPLQDSDEEEV